MSARSQSLARLSRSLELATPRGRNEQHPAVAPGNARRCRTRARRPIRGPATRSVSTVLDADLRAQDVLAQTFVRRLRASSRGQDRENFLGRRAQQREQRDDASLRVVQPGERRSRRRRASRRRRTTGPAENARRPAPRNASTPNPSARARQIDAGELLIFVFAGVSYGRKRPILAEFAPVPNAPSESVSTSVAAAIHGRERPLRIAVQVQNPPHPSNSAGRRARSPRVSAIGKKTAAASTSRTVTMNQRPLSPHLGVYKFMYTMSLSILHRITGCARDGRIPAVRLVADGARHRARRVRARPCTRLSSPVAKLLLVGFTFSFVYHFCNGIRHLVWDTGRGLERAQARRSGALVVVASLLLDRRGRLARLPRDGLS